MALAGVGFTAFTLTSASVSAMRVRRLSLIGTENDEGRETACESESEKSESNNPAHKSPSLTLYPRGTSQNGGYGQLPFGSLPVFPGAECCYRRDVMTGLLSNSSGLFSLSPPAVRPAHTPKVRAITKSRRNAPHPTTRKRPRETLGPFAPCTQTFGVSGCRRCVRRVVNARKF
jgi:hypothetical protein